MFLVPVKIWYEDVIDCLQIVCYLRHGRYRLEAEKVWAAAAPSVRNHVVYVVVDGLPRDALVEWQVRPWLSQLYSVWSVLL